jgi:hypothetical protein
MRRLKGKLTKKMIKAADIQKSGHLHEDPVADALLRKLRSFLDTTEPELVYFLTNLWGNQGKAITYKELREAILRGEINADWLEQWRQDYSRFVTEHLQPKWIEAMQAAVADMEAKYPEWYFNPSADGVREWTRDRAAEFVTSSTEAQIQGIRALVQRAAIMEALNVDQLSRAIRPMVGLYYQQSVANLNYYNTLIENGLKAEKALDLATRYAARQHRYRGYLISRTELAFAYNKGADEGIRQAQAKGYLGDMVKVWSTALDERTCPICSALEGQVIAMDEEFNFGTKLAASNPGIRRTPPAHPNCRCAVMYKPVMQHPND